jgi:PAS domain S-box-containing protein
MSNQELNYNITPMDIDKKIIELTYRPTPSDRELEWDKSKQLLSKTDSKGNILYANESFIDVCGYDDFELMDKNHNLLRHPDMPKVIFKLLWENLAKSKSSCMIVKNMSKTGRYYWVYNDITSTVDDYDNVFYTGKQKSVSHDIIANNVEVLYKKLLQVEKASGIQSSENYLIGFLEERNKTYVEYINGLMTTGKDSIGEEADEDLPVKNIPKKKGFFTSFFADDNSGKKK